MRAQNFYITDINAAEDPGGTFLSRPWWLDHHM